jgi:hypothetical protein
MRCSTPSLRLREHPGIEVARSPWWSGMRDTRWESGTTDDVRFRRPRAGRAGRQLGVKVERSPRLSSSRSLVAPPKGHAIRAIPKPSSQMDHTMYRTGDGLTDRPCSDDEDDFAHGSLLTRRTVTACASWPVTWLTGPGP